MDTISLYSSTEFQLSIGEFEDAFYNARRRYSLRHLIFSGDVTQENILDALQKSIQICKLAGINSRHHFKKIYVYDADLNTICIDWCMSKKGFNLMVMQLPSLNEKLARWLWKLADL
ncbi:hypothetical protein [Runella sp.]|jgi:hypothetical protein|uniref:hypothetical protein n=1 Tax=Runella sp. TaxID=1960881 RepID=UPI002634D192|nr:hypothetical protein [Runella sp.]